MFCYLYGNGMELLPTSTVGEAYHEVIVAGMDVGRNLNICSGIIPALTGRDGEVLIIDPCLAFAVFMLMLMFIIVVTLAHFVVVIMIVGLSAM